MNVCPAQTETEFAAWDRYVHAHPGGTPFHLAAWQRVVERTIGARPSSWYVERDGRICGVLPLCEVRGWWSGSTLVSVPFGVVGGVCADHAEARAALVTHAREEASRRRVKYIELRHRTPVEGDWARKDLYVTFERPISNDAEANMAAIPRKQRRMIRQGEKAGLSVRIGGLEFLRSFYDVYAHSVRNLGTPVFSISLFRSVLEEFGNAARILTVWRDDRLMAGVLALFFRDRVMPYYGGAYREALAYAANDFMYWELMQYAAQKGYRVFDFGRSKRGTGAFDFKRHWGFEPQPLAYQYHLVTQSSLPDRSPMNPKYALAIAVWKRLPVPLTKWLGPRVVAPFV